jgi:hypothetical protein
MLRQFERGLLSVHVVSASIVAAVLLLVLGAIFLDLRLSVRVKSMRVVVAIVIAAVSFALIRSDRSADLSEDRRNSFSAADEQLLRSIELPLTIRLYLAAEDPRDGDYERNVLTKLKRTMRAVRVEYPYAGRSALFENDDRYGTIVYRLGSKELASRSTTEEIVLDELEMLAGLSTPERGIATYPGYPLNASPRGAAMLFYVVWPLLVVAGRLKAGLRRGDYRAATV